MSEVFSRKTFGYLDGAKKNKNNRAWFEKNKDAYEEFVRAPFSHLVLKLNKKISDELIGVEISPKKICKPLRRKGYDEDGLIRANSMAYLSQKTTSMFESNPGIYLSIGADRDDCMYGVGLYWPSGRQMGHLRDKLVTDYDEIHGILTSSKLKRRMGSLTGEKYKRFPKAYAEDNPAAKYLWHKQFFLAKEVSRKTMTDKGFSEVFIKDIEATVPFIKWLRKTVGIYRGRVE